MTSDRYRSINGLEVRMSAVRVSEDIMSVSDFKAQAADCLRRVAVTDRPIVITQNGKAAGVLISPREFDRLTERARFQAAVVEGLEDSNAGRVSDHDDVVRRMRARFENKVKR